MRSSTIFLFILLVAVVTGSFSLYEGWKSGEIQKIIIDPTASAVKKVQEIVSDFNVNPPLKKDITNDNEKNFAPTASPNINRISSTIQPQKPMATPTLPQRIDYPDVTTTSPTIIPGSPGSREWDEEFWRKWDEMKKQNEESQKKVEEAQKKFCLDNPTLCN
jgi:hypothetical protein